MRVLEIDPGLRRLVRAERLRRIVVVDALRLPPGTPLSFGRQRADVFALGRERPRAIPMRLRHELLADLACAHRPPVTGALNRLAVDGRIERNLWQGWDLLGSPPV